MKRFWLFIGILVVCVSLFLLGGCSRDFECEIWLYNGSFWEYHSWDIYSGKNASEAEENCEDDWSSSYDCRNCVPD